MISNIFRNRVKLIQIEKLIEIYKILITTRPNYLDREIIEELEIERRNIFKEDPRLEAEYIMQKLTED